MWTSCLYAAIWPWDALNLLEGEANLANPSPGGIHWLVKIVDLVEREAVAFHPCRATAACSYILHPICVGLGVALDSYE